MKERICRHRGERSTRGAPTHRLPAHRRPRRQTFASARPRRQTFAPARPRRQAFAPTRARSARLTLAASAIALVVAACAPASAGTNDIEVVASFYPLQFVAEEGGGSPASVARRPPAAAA